MGALFTKVPVAIQFIPVTGTVKTLPTSSKKVIKTDVLKIKCKSIILGPSLWAVAA